MMNICFDCTPGHVCNDHLAITRNVELTASAKKPKINK